MSRSTIIIAPPPTPNGDLHAGHLAGPYLAADVHARFLRAQGSAVRYVTGTDDSQTYVVASAHKLGVAPDALAATATAAIRRTLTRMAIGVDGFAEFDEGYRQTVLAFLGALHADGKFRLRTVRLPYCRAAGGFLMEGLVAGECPVCLAESRGGLCESCGHPVDVAELRRPRSVTHPDAPIELVFAQILVLPMEDYRDRLTGFYAERASQWRPRVRQLVADVLARPLPDFPITFPGKWGIPAPFPETPGQVINAWAEGMPASMYCTWAATDRSEPADAEWLAERAASLVYFLGFDNAYFWGLTHLALLLAHEGRYILPEFIVGNEFYELDHEKFSTSRGHVLWANDLLALAPRDIVRFYLCLTAPEFARTNFSRDGFDLVVSQRLVHPWKQLAERLARAVGDRDPGKELPASEVGMRESAAIAARFAHGYALPTFSLSRSADTLTQQLRRLVTLSDGVDARDDRQVGDLLLATQTLLGCAAPILVDVAAQAAAGGAQLAWPTTNVRAVRPFALPDLTADRPAARRRATTPHYPELRLVTTARGAR